MLRIVKQSDGKYSVWRGEELVKADLTNAEAWRMLDRDEGEPISRSEKVSDWIVGQILGGE